MTTLHLRGTGGAEWDQDVPTEPAAFRLFRSQVASGFLTPLDDDGNVWTPDEVAAWVSGDQIAEGAATGEKSGEAAPNASGDEPEPYPAGKSIDIVLAWVGADHERAAEALTAEQAKAKPRPKLVEHLTSLPFEVPHQPAGAGSIVSEA